MQPRNPTQAALPKPSEVETQHLIQSLKAELNFQHNANTRLSKELSFCLHKLGVPRVEVQHNDQQMHHQTDLAYLAPLFLAYDDQISKLENVMDNLMDELKDMEKRIALVQDDNTYLRKQLEDKNEQILKMYKHGVSDHDNIQTVFSKLEKEDLEDRLRLLNEENFIYIEKLKKYESQIFELSGRVDSMSRNEQGYINQIGDLQQQSKQLEIDYDNARVKNEVLDSKLKNQTQLAAIADEDKSEFAQRLSRSDNENKVLKHQIQSLKQQVASIGTNAHQNKNELEQELTEMHQKEREYFDKQVHLERELDQIRDELRVSKKELDQTRNNLEQTIRMMENYENKLAILMKKEENYKIMNKTLKEEKESVFLERDRYQLKEQQFDQTLQNCILKHREEITQLKDNNDKSTDQLKNRYRIIIEQREEEIARLNSEITQLQTQHDRLAKENKSIKAEIARMENIVKQDIEVNYQQADDLHRQINELSERNQLLEQKLQDAEADINTQKQASESQVRVLTNSNADLRQALEHTRSQLTSVTQELSTIKGKTNQLARTNSNLIEEIAKTKRHYEQRLEQIQDEYTHKVKTLQMQMDEALKREKQSRDRSVQLLQQYDMIEEKLKTEFTNRILEVETANHALKAQNKQLSIKLHEIKNQAQMQAEPQFGTLRKV